MEPSRTTLALGRLVDIDTQGQLRDRPDSGLLWDSQGRILHIGSAQELKQAHPDADVLDFSNGFLVPGAVDCHIHFPQTRALARQATALLDWLDTHIWPEERRYKELSYAETMADTFLSELFRHGTTTALVFGSQFVHANDALFQRAHRHRMALLTGLTLQDRHTHPELELNREDGERGSLELLQRWHDKDRLRYVVTSRFSPACTDDQLALCGELLQAHDGVYFQTHINESVGEIAWVRELFPDSNDYLDTYEKHGLLGERSMYAHSIHTTEDELQRMGESRSVAIHCPSSNSFLGSGAFPWEKHLEHGVRVGVGTDVGAGLTFSMWREMGHAYLVQMQRSTRYPLPGGRMLKAMTMDGAEALGLDDELGSFEVGKWADVVHLHSVNPTLDNEPETSSELEQLLFSLAILGDPAVVKQTLIAGETVYKSGKTT